MNLIHTLISEIHLLNNMLHFVVAYSLFLCARDWAVTPQKWGCFESFSFLARSSHVVQVLYWGQMSHGWWKQHFFYSICINLQVLMA